MFGLFVPPSAEQSEGVIDLAVAADGWGLDLFAVQDHPYQPAFLDTWTLLSSLARVVTERIRLFPDVANLPLRPPALLARSVASLDILSGGRAELGLGAGAFWDAIVANGGPRRSPGEAVEALEEAIAIIRALWTPGRGPRIDGKHYRVHGAKPGPFPVHRVGIWVGAYGDRMLRLVGRIGDGWVPSAGYLPPNKIGQKTKVLDHGAEAVGRDPAQIRRIYNVDGKFSQGGRGFLQGPPEVWVEQLAGLALEHGISAFVLSAQPGDTDDAERFAKEVAPAVRALVAAERSDPDASKSSTPTGPDVSSTEVGDQGRENQQMLLRVHDALREQLTELRDAVDLLARGKAAPEDLRSLINRLAMRQNYMSVGTFCAAYCRFVATHHTVEDRTLFPDLRSLDADLGPVIDRLEQEHEEIARVLFDLDEATVAMMSDGDRVEDVRAVGDRLAGLLLEHLAFEEEQLLPAIGRLPAPI